jgi:hypothetical protein
VSRICAVYPVEPLARRRAVIVPIVATRLTL